MKHDGCTHGPRDFGQLGRFAMPQTWRSPFAKASEAEYKWLQDIADAAMPEVRRRFIAAIEAIRGTIKESELQAAIETGSVETVMRFLGIEDRMTAAMGSSIIPPIEDVFIDAGRAVPAIQRAGGGELAMRFDISNPAASAFLRSYDFGLIREVSTETRDAVRNVVLNAVQYGGHPREQAKQIKELVGLTVKQTQAVQNYRAALELEERPADQVDRMVARYNAKMLRLRGETIARTETIRAGNAAQDMAWEQAATNGLLNRTTLRRQWLVTPDDRLCVYCAQVPGLNPGGRPLGVAFETPFGLMLRPPLHPNCRCVLQLVGF